MLYNPPLPHDRYHAIRQTLHERFPAVFPERGKKPVALKIGIHDDLQAKITDTLILPDDLANFLKMWTFRLVYQEALVAAGPRFSLDGEPAGEVTAAEARFAEKAVRRIKQRILRRIGDKKREAAMASSAESTMAA